MQRRWLEMQDYWTLQPTKLDENKKHLFECKDNKSPTGHSLLVKLAATHAGKVNNNKRFYRPDKMAAATHTWTNKTNPVPVLVEHNKKGDVMGRVRSARYVDETHKFDQEYPIIRDTVFYSTDSTKIPLFDSVDWIAENLMDQDDYSGLGYIELGTQITNPSAIRKIFNDEFLNVSVGFRTDQAICSICHTDWAAEDKCNHVLGSKVNGKDTFLITGNLDYNEVSFVNFPADPFATTLSVAQFTDSLNKKFYLGLDSDKFAELNESAGLIMTDSISLDDDITISYEDSMDLNNLQFETLADAVVEIKSKDLTDARAFEFKNAIEKLVAETPEEKASLRSIKSTLNSRIKKEKWSAPVAIEATDENLEAEINVALATEVEDAAETIASATSTPVLENWDNFTYANADEQTFFEDTEGIVNEIAAMYGADTYLTDSADKTTFCGPNKSFAVWNLASSDAAKAALSTAPISGDTRVKILNNINALGFTAQDTEEFAVLFTDSKKGVGEKVIGTYSDLHNHFTAADWETRGKIRDLHYAVGNHMSTHMSKEKSEQALINDGHNVNAYSDSLEKFVTEFTDGKAAEALTLITSLDKFYDASSDDMKPRIYEATQSVISDWSTDGYVAYAKKRLAECADNLQVIPAAELSEKEDAVNELTAERDGYISQLAAERKKTATFFTEAKRALATQVIMSKMIAGVDEFKSLTAEGLDAKIEEFSKRNIISLRDSVKDILTEKKFLTPSSQDSQETQTRVEDSTQVTDADAVTNMTDSETTEEARPSPEINPGVFKYLSPAEKRRYLAERGYIVR